MTFEDLLLKDVGAIYATQQYFHPSTIEGLATSLSKLADPRYGYTVIFPIMFWWAGPKAGGVVLLTAALSEWTNIILKWLFQGDRPYWWVGEHPDLWNSSQQQLVQVPITCETGPGMPSGHVMVVLAVLLCCCRYVGGTDPGGERGGEGGRGWLRRLTQHLVLAFSVMIGLTRVLVSTHFFHQVFVGVVIGLLLYNGISRSRSIHRHLLWTTPTSPALLLLLSFLLLVNGLLFYWLLLFLNFDPAFSVLLARKHCQEISWVHLNTTPFFSLVRSAGTVLGMSLVPRMRMGLLPRGGMGVGGRMSAVGVTGVAIVLLGYIDLGFSLLGSKVLGFYAEGLVKAALVPLVTVLPLWFMNNVIH